MKKEVVIAIVFGGILGLVVAFGIWRVNSALAPKGQGEEARATPSPKAEFLITLAKPENNDVTPASPLEVTGLTKAGALVTISGQEDDYVTDANSQGIFAESVDLTAGVNQILLTAFDADANSAKTSLLVVFSSEFGKIVENLSTPTPGTSEADTVREKVEQKVSEALNKPKSYLGLVTDISEGTIQLKSADGEIKQVGTAEETAFVKTDPTVKTVSFKDLAIGDFIVAMGFKNGNAVLNAKRILITPPLPDVKREVILGKVVKVTSKDLVIAQSKDAQTVTVTPNKNAVYLSRTQDKITKAKFADLKEEAEVIVFGERGEKTFAARTIFIVATGS